MYDHSELCGDPYGLGLTVDHCKSMANGPATCPVMCGVCPGMYVNINHYTNNTTYRIKNESSSHMNITTRMKSKWL